MKCLKLYRVADLRNFITVYSALSIKEILIAHNAFKRGAWIAYNNK